ncbi:DUF3037 domain-containing protein [uncultured Jatrophihabitans sp.]|uniref:DUF3037 domain-containing protein n=1 Tax=uncultured Jatrophihabitans sp. TaxID=1610747 RepID=UPI0035C9CC02
MTRYAFEYVVLRVVPRVERGESINAGVLVYCRDVDYLGAAVHLDRARLEALDPTVDVAAVKAVLASVTDSCERSETDHGALFRWLTAPRSTVVQAGPVHTGLTTDPAAEPARLLQLLVLPVGRS